MFRVVFSLKVRLLHVIVCCFQKSIFTFAASLLISYRMEFDKTRWSCSFNSDHTARDSARVWEIWGVSGVWGGGSLRVWQVKGSRVCGGLVWRGMKVLTISSNLDFIELYFAERGFGHRTGGAPKVEWYLVGNKNAWNTEGLFRCFWREACKMISSASRVSSFNFVSRVSIICP